MHGPDRIPSSQITPPELYFDRRNFLRVSAAAASLGSHRHCLPLAEPDWFNGGQYAASSKSVGRRSNTRE